VAAACRRLLGQATRIGATAALLAGATSCDTFRGSVVALSVAWPVRTMAGMQVPLTPSQRLEMWARLGSGELRRIVADVGADEESRFTGFSVVYAVDPNDPCLIRGLDRDDELCDRVTDTSSALERATCGAHLLGLRAHADPTDGGSDPLMDPAQRDRADLLRQQLVQQVRKIVAFSPTAPLLVPEPQLFGRAPQPLLALVQHNVQHAGDPRPMLAAELNSTTADDPTRSQQRLVQCRRARDVGGNNQPNPYFYVGNPRQYTKPLAGFFFGVFSFATAPTMADPALPTQNLSGISFSVPFSLDSLQEIYVLVEDSGSTSMPTDPTARKLMLMRRLPDAAAGRGAIKLVVLANTDPNLMLPMFTTTIGTATVLTNLDSRLD
jgi:hypothetical protein